MREEVEELKKEVEDVKEKSFAYEILSDYKKQNRRLFIIWVITFISFLCLLGYTIYLLNDISTIEETTQGITAFDTINGNIANKGVIYGED